MSPMNKITTVSSPGALTFRALLVFSGRDPAAFAVKEESGRVLVEGGGNTVSYASASWVAHFGRDLYQGLYGPAPEPRWTTRDGFSTDPRGTH